MPSLPLSSLSACSLLFSLLFLASYLLKFPDGPLELEAFSGACDASSEPPLFLFLARAATYFYGVRSVAFVRLMSLLCVLGAIAIAFRPSPPSALLLLLVLDSRTVPVLLRASPDSLLLLLSVASMYFPSLERAAFLLPSLSYSAYGSLVSLCVFRRRARYLAYSLLLTYAAFVLREGMAERVGDKTVMSEEGLLLENSGAFLCSDEGVHGEHPGGKRGSGMQRVYGVRAPSANASWKIVLDGVAGNPAPSSPVDSESIVHLMHNETGKYLQTFDVASPLTMTNQEVSCGSAMADDTRFLLVSRTLEGGAPLKYGQGFFLKHLKTGVFVSVLGRRVYKGVEVNGAKETGKNTRHGPERGVWRVRDGHTAGQGKPTRMSELSRALALGLRSMARSHALWVRSWRIRGALTWKEVPLFPAGALVQTYKVRLLSAAMYTSLLIFAAIRQTALLFAAQRPPAKAGGRSAFFHQLLSLAINSLLFALQGEGFFAWRFMAMGVLGVRELQRAFRKKVKQE